MFRPPYVAGRTRKPVQRRSQARHSQACRPLFELLEERTLLSLQPVTISDPSFWGDGGSGSSSLPSISGDGQLVVFESSAPNLVPNDFNGVSDVFLYDRGTGRVSLISVDAAGDASADAGGNSPQISPDGHFVLFVSKATNLVDPPVNSGIGAFRRDNVYLRDLLTGHTTLVSINAAGSNDGDSNSRNASISAEGRRIVFESEADDLVPGDTNGTIDVFLRELHADGTGTTTRISVSSGDAQGNRASTNPSISANGQFVVFQSDADNLVSNDNNTAPDIFIHNLNTNSTKLVTADPSGQQSANTGDSRLSRQPISADGRSVVFQSGANNLVPQNTGFQTNAFVRDIETDTTRLLSINRAGNGGSDGLNVVITPDGRFAGFISRSDDVASDVNDTNGRQDVYLSTITPTTITNRLVSVNTAGTSGGDGTSGTGQHPFDFSGGFPQISDDGRFVAFAGDAGNLAPGISDANQGQTNFNFRRDVFIRDVQSGGTSAVSVALGGASTGNAGSYTPAMSSDGRFVAFESDASDLRPNDSNRQQDVFVRDRTAGTTELASRHSPLLPAELLAGGEVMDTTPDGRFVAFTSARGDLLTPGVPGVGGGFTSYLFVRDRQTGVVQLASVRPDGSTYGNFGGGFFPDASLSADGRFVAFVTQLNDLDATITGGVGGVYVRDLLSGVTRLVSRNSTTGAPANSFHGSIQVAISNDNRYVAFTSDANNLVSGVNVPYTQGYGNVYLHDRQTGQTRLVSLSAAGAAAGNGLNFVGNYQPQFSGDGRKLVYYSLSSDLVAGVSDANNDFDVFVYDLAAGTTTLASVSTMPNTAGDAGSGFGGFGFQPALSATGQFVVFGSYAANLVAQSNNGQSQIYVRDLVNNTTRLASVNDAGDAADRNSLDASISADGSRVLFESTATNLTGLSSNGRNQLYVRDLNANSTHLVSINAAGTAGANDDSGYLVSPSASPSFDPAALSGDGRYVAFRSLASDLVNGFVDGNGSGGGDLYLRDLGTGTTVLVTYNNSGTASANRGSNGRHLLAANSPIVVFDALASDLVSGDRNDGFSSPTNDVFAYTFAGAGMISGTVFNDADGSGTQDAGEAGIPFWTVYLDSNGNRRFDRSEMNVQTDARGNYAFTGLPAGSYSVVADIDDGFVPTAPAFPRTYSVTLATDTTSVTGRNFGARRAPADLVIASVTAPTTAEPGSVITVSWLVHNAGSGAITASSQDAVYLSSDGTLDANDILLATVPRTGTLAAGGTYTGTTTVAVPAVLPGSYFFLVGVDRRYQVPNETNRANNILAADLATVLSLPALVLGTPSAGQFGAAAQDRYFQVTVDPGQTLVVTLDSAAADGATELYVSRLHLPTAADHDFASLSPQPDQTLALPTTQPGAYYILARSRTGAAATAGFTLTAATVNLGIESISPNTGGNTGGVTIELHGTRLTRATQVSLASGTTTVAASRIDFRDATLLFATFDLTGQAAGAYDVRVVDGAATATLAGAFTVAPGQTNLLEIHLITPANIRRGRQSSVLVEYTNTSNTDVPAPLLELTATNAVLRLDDQRDFIGDATSGSSIQFLAIAPDGPAGVLRPGERGSVRVFFKASGGEAGITVQFGVRQFASTTSSIDWAGLKANLRPSTVPADAWDAIYANFTASVGATTGQLQDLLDKDASYLSDLGIRTTDVGRLLAFEFQQANDFLPGPITTSAVDDSLAAPGLNLTFSRVHLQPLSARYRLGALGRGWTSNWEISATTDSQGNVTLEQSGGLRFFAKQSDGTYLGAPGNFSTLTLSGGVVRLREKDGTLFVFRPDGKLDYVADPHDNRITAGYNAGGQLTSLTHSSGPSLTLAYNTAGRLSQVTDSAGRTVTYAYDAGDEHLLGVTTVKGTTQYEYVTGQGATKEHALASITDVAGSHAFFDYDARGRLTGRRRDGNAEAITLAYGNAAGVTFRDAANAATTVLFNDAGQPELVRDALGRTGQFNYDSNFNLVQLVTPTNSTLSYSYDLSGNITRTVDPLGQENDFTYDPLFNQLTSLRDARGNTTRDAYGAQADLLSITYPNGSVERFTYDPLGNLAESLNRRGHVMDYSTNSHGLVARKTYGDGTHIDFSYDDRDNLRTATDSRGTITLDYDGADRLTRIAYPNGRFLAFTYDSGGRRIRSVDQDGFTVNYQYDAVGRLAGLRDGDGAIIVTYTYDAVGRLSRKDLGNGTFTTYEYDTAGQILNLVNHAPGGSVNSRFEYTYDDLGQRASTNTLDGRWTYEYDLTGQLTHAVFASNNPATIPDQNLRYVYDAAGNRTRTVTNGVTTEYVTNNLNEYTQVGTVSYTYDADGNLIGQNDATSATSYSFDDENQLLSVTGPVGTFGYEYDPFGNRTATVQNGTRAEYLIDPAGLDSVVSEYGPGSSFIAHYTHGLGLVSRVDTSGATFYDFDALGSTAGLTGAAGNYVNRYSYLPFGETTVLSAALPNLFQYNGQFDVTNNGSGLVQMGFRNYSAALGQFTSMDPIGPLGGDANFRRYVANNPASLVDPVGLALSSGEAASGATVNTVETIIGEIASFEPSEPPYVIERPFIPEFENTEEVVQYIKTYAEANGDKLSPYLQRLSEGPSKLQPLVPKLAGAARALGNVGNAALIAVTIPEAASLAEDLGKHFRPAQDFGNGAGQAAEPYLRDLCEISPLLCQQLAKILNAFDPNDIVGAAGFGTQHSVAPPQTLPYTIHFENQASASAPAQEVFVTHTLDADVDLSTFALGDFGFGSTVIDVPDGLQSYETNIDAQNPDGSPLRVNVSAGLDPQTGIVTWTFRSVDPATGQLPEDALAGFLPPNDATQRGEGFVTYTVRPKASLATGTPIDAQASIVFDTNAPVVTNTFRNTIDAGAPSSSVDPLPAVTNSARFTVSWFGSDDPGGSGIGTFDVFVSADGGPFQPWLTGTPEASAVYDGQFGHTYGFYSVATDNVGHRQATPSTAQATTQLVGLPGKLKGTVFEDFNGNGLQDESEPPLAGWMVFLDLNDNGTPDTGEVSRLSNAAGKYRFRHLEPRSYTVVLVPQPGYVGDSAVATAPSGGVVLGVDLGAYRPGTIKGVVFHDANRNGVRDSGEAGLSGWTVFLDTNGDGSPSGDELKRVTRSSGRYQFRNLAPGSYLVAQVMESGWVQTFPADGGPQSVDLRSGTIVHTRLGNDRTAVLTARGIAEFTELEADYAALDAVLSGSSSPRDDLVDVGM